MIVHRFILLVQASDFSTLNQAHTYNPPNSFLYYLVLVSSSVIVLTTIYYAIKWLIWPGETNDDHIKRRILDMDSKESDNHG